MISLSQDPFGWGLQCLDIPRRVRVLQPYIYIVELAAAVETCPIDPIRIQHYGGIYNEQHRSVPRRGTP